MAQILSARGRSSVLNQPLDEEDADMAYLLAPPAKDTGKLFFFFLPLAHASIHKVCVDTIQHHLRLRR